VKRTLFLKEIGKYHQPQGKIWIVLDGLDMETNIFVSLTPLLVVVKNIETFMSLVSESRWQNQPDLKESERRSKKFLTESVYGRP